MGRDDEILEEDWEKTSRNKAMLNVDENYIKHRRESLFNVIINFYHLRKNYFEILKQCFCGKFSTKQLNDMILNIIYWKEGME